MIMNKEEVIEKFFPLRELKKIVSCGEIKKIEKRATITKLFYDNAENVHLTDLGRRFLRSVANHGYTNRLIVIFSSEALKNNGVLLWD